MSVLDELFGDVSAVRQQSTTPPQVGLIESSSTQKRLPVPAAVAAGAGALPQYHHNNHNHTTAAAAAAEGTTTRSHAGVGQYFSATLSAPQRSHTQTLSLLSSNYTDPRFPSPATVWQWISAGRLAEALAALDGVGFVRKAEAEAQGLLRSRNDDDALEQAVGHRDRMRIFRAQALSLHAGTTFCADFQNVSLLPFLSEGHCTRARAQVRTKLQQKFAANFQGGQSWSVILEEERRQLRREVKYAAEAIEALVLTQAHSVPELILLATILQMNRAVFFLCASLLPIRHHHHQRQQKQHHHHRDEHQKQPHEKQQQQKHDKHLADVEREDNDEELQTTTESGHSNDGSTSFPAPNDDDDDVGVKPFMPSAAVSAAAAALRNDGAAGSNRQTPTPMMMSAESRSNHGSVGGGCGRSAAANSSSNGLVADVESEIENALLAASHLIDRPSWRTVAALNRRRIVAHSAATVARHRRKQQQQELQQQQQHHAATDENSELAGTPTLIKDIASAMQRCLRVMNKFKAGGKVKDTNVLVSCSVMLAELLSALDVALPEALDGTGNNRTGAGVVTSTQQQHQRQNQNQQQNSPRLQCDLCGATTSDAVTIKVPRYDENDNDEENSGGGGVCFGHQEEDMSASPHPQRVLSGGSAEELSSPAVFVLTASKLAAAVEVAASERNENDEDFEFITVDRDVWSTVTKHLK